MDETMKEQKEVPDAIDQPIVDQPETSAIVAEHPEESYAAPAQGEVLDERVPAFDAEYTLKAGEIIHVNGLPFQLKDAAVVYGEQSNIDLALIK